VNVSENGVCPVCPTNCHFKGGVMIKVLDFGGPYFRQTHVCWLKHVITPFFHGLIPMFVGSTIVISPCWLPNQ
jgi:hypothetical protein